MTHILATFDLTSGAAEGEEGTCAAPSPTDAARANLRDQAAEPVTGLGPCTPDPDMPPSLLVVDDRPTISFAVSDYFIVRGWEVECAANVAEAEAILRRRTFNVLIADLSLSEPGSVDGLDLTRRVREDWPRTRTIILTAYGTPEIERLARRIGVDAFMHKPAPLAELARVADALAGAPDEWVGSEPLSQE